MTSRDAAAHCTGTSAELHPATSAGAAAETQPTTTAGTTAELHPATPAGTAVAHCIVRKAEVATDAVPLNVIELRNRIGQRPETLPEGLFEECMEQLRYAKANVLGFVMNGCVEGASKHYQYGSRYGYGYGYRYENKQK